MKKSATVAYFLISGILLAACAGLPTQHAAIQDASEQKLTLGNAQIEIKKGMPQSQVVKVLGSSNIVTD